MKRNWSILRDGQDENSAIAYINARIIDPESKLDLLGYVVTSGTKIIDIGSEFKNFKGQSVDEIIDCHGNILMPGIIDIHVHFREPGFERKEDLQSGSKAAAAGGVTAVICQPNTNPRISTTTILRYIKYRSYEVSSVRIHCYASITNDDGTIVDMPKLAQEGALGFTDDGLPVSNSAVMKGAIECADSFGFLLAQHAEDLSLSSGGCMNEGATSYELGLSGIPNVSESVMVARDIELMKKFQNARYHVLHVSTSESMDIIRLAKKNNMKVTCEVTPHHFILTDESVKLNGTFAKMNPPLRSQKDVDTMIHCIKNGEIDCIATDHAPHDIKSKGEFMSDSAFGIIGLETMLPLSLELHFKHGMPLLDVLAKLTYAPADVVGVPYGRVKVGADADFIVVDLDVEWVIAEDDFVGKSSNSPFVGKSVKGRVLRTVILGKTVYTLSLD